MNDIAELALHAVLIGAGATALTDLWAVLRKRMSGTAAPEWALVGRWIAYLPRGRFRHVAIAASPPLRGERAIGWSSHYLIGIGFAAVLLALWGDGWTQHPTLVPALIVGVGSVAAPFLVMQPAMGAGFAASRTPDPNAARRRSIVMHTVFGLGLYATGWLVSVLR